MIRPRGISQLFRPGALVDPYPLYHELRSTDPVHWDDYWRAWAVTRYADVVSALNDPRFAAARLSRPPSQASQDVAASAHQSLSRQILFCDPPDHTRMRGLINKLFMAQSIASLRPLVQQIADQLIDRVEPSGRLDAIRDLGNKLPVMTIMSIMGMPPEDLDLIKRWCDEYADLSAFAFDRIAQALEAWRSLTEYFRSLVSNRRAAPQSDLLSSLIVEGEQRGVISSDELLANCVLLLTAGHETTTNLIGNGLLALLRNPDQLQKLRDDPNLINGAVEELLRFDSPVQLTTRLVSEDMEFAGRRLKKGQTVYLVLGAANRDPEQFADPDRLEITRQECRHLAFGHGIHFCLGASLGRLEGQIALNTLLRRLPRLRQEECEIEWHPNPVIRGVIALPLCF